MDIKVVLTIHTQDSFTSNFPDVSIEVDSIISVIPENPIEEEILGRVTSIMWEYV